MSPSHFHRNRALHNLKRATETTSTTSAPVATSTGTNAYAQQILNSVPKSTVALAVVLSVFGLLVLGICTWRYRVRRKLRKSAVDSEDPLYRAATNSSFDSEKHAGLEKPQEVFIPVPTKGEAAWTPQVRTYLGVPLKNGELPKHVQAAREGREWKNEPSTSPPYQEKLTGPGVKPAAKAPISKPLNIVTSSEFPASRFSNPTPLPLTTVSEEHPEPLPSPARTSSFPQKHRHSRSRSVSSKHISGQVTTKITPSQARHSRSGSSSDVRLMTVISTFRPSLDDELLIKSGQQCRLLEEYHDGWCLVQLVGESESRRGVVPRFCLVDRQSAPTHSRKRSLTTAKV
ncbi:hypothetical protein D9757_002819 [Collybiopsis confluens]|uniref:SH3 domain-containing protein n=1 Tax=Collybiopsis confluens TaxID=2823264 RepID=A0A8H5MDT2_9AGAR|nr:hypothetical protein D9757_002819 [Collybiopsis confluens]